MPIIHATLSAKQCDFHFYKEFGLNQTLKVHKLQNQSDSLNKYLLSTYQLLLGVSL